MKYSELCAVYEELGRTSKRLEKIDILAEFLKKLKSENEKWIYLLKGKVLSDYDVREFGISRQLIIKTISKASGSSESEVVKEFNKIGDLGEIAEKLMSNKKQHNLFHSGLTVEKVFENLHKIFELEGRGSVEKKINLVAELLTNATGNEAKWIVRIVLSDLRIGVADSTLISSLAKLFFRDDEKEGAEKISNFFDLNNDFAEVFQTLKKGKSELEKSSLLKPGRPINVMLPVKVDEIEEAFRICGTPCAIEHKYDGFRVVISKKDNEIKLFTRRLEEVTKQFPDVVETVKKNIHGASFVIDSEVVGYNPKTKKPKPFESISQRIKRKYDIEKLRKELPVEINAFDIIYYDNKILTDLPFKERRKILEKIISPLNHKIRTATQFITDEEKEAIKFYKEALKIGEEGIIMKNLEAPYRPGRRVGYMIKMKPEIADLDFVIVGAEYGSGKRAGWLTSYNLACISNYDFLEVGKVSSGLKEKEEEGTTYKEMTNLLKQLIKEEKGKSVSVKPKLVVSVTYQNIQKSPSYSSGYALRFPRITHYRPERGIYDIASLEDIKKEAKKQNTKAL